jgi:two-component system, OmpR family, sensor kinase
LRFDTLRNRLVLLIFAITAAAIGFIYLYVVPQLESSLTAEKLRRLERLGDEQGPRLARALQTSAPEEQVRELVQSIGQATESRVTLLAVRDESGTPVPAFVIADSQGESTAIQGDYLSADATAAEGHVTSGVETVAGNRVGTSSVPIEAAGRTEWVAVLSSPLAEVDDNVALIRRQILIAGAIALVGASLAGFWAAGAASRRLRRLRQAAEQVAEGDFGGTIPIDSSDELGQLARTFNEMQRHLARLDRARKEFIANASHELRTPIFSLGGFVELLEHEEPDEASRDEFVRTMREQVDRLTKLTTDLLDLSKLDADAIEIRSEAVDLDRLAERIVADFGPAAALHGSSIAVVARGATAPVARADPDRVAQILRILLDNALTHTPEGTAIKVTIEPRNGVCELTVSDDGPGIPPRARARVFERFYTVDSVSGSGLGLAIARELALRMEGGLAMSSRAGHTNFVLELPTPAGDRRPATAGVAA